MPNDVRIAASQREQSKASKKATLDLLRGKRRRTKTIPLEINGEKVEMTFAALSSHDLDALQGKHTPTAEQRARGLVFNPDTFAPSLVAACMIDPEMTEAEAKEIWASGAWSTGELNFLFETCSQLCMEGLDIPFSVSG